LGIEFDPLSKTSISPADTLLHLSDVEELIKTNPREPVLPTSPVPEQICASSFLLLSSLRASMHSYCPSERLVICRHASGNGRWPSPGIGKGFLSWFSLRIVH